MNLIIFKKMGPPLHSVTPSLLRKLVLPLPKSTKVVPLLSGATYMKNSALKIIPV